MQQRRATTTKTAAAMVLAMAMVMVLAMVVNNANAQDGNDGKGEDAAVNQLFNAFNKSGAPLNGEEAEKQKLESLARLSRAVRERFIAEIVRTLDEDGRLPVYGDGDITIYEFSDYQCGYCRNVFSSYLNDMAKRGEIKIKVVEFPILGDTSERLAKVALAAWKNGEYEKYHQLLMQLPAPKTDEDFALLTEGLETDDKTQIEIENLLKRNNAIANALGVNFTPAFIIDGKYISGAPKEEKQFRQLINR